MDLRDTVKSRWVIALGFVIAFYPSSGLTTANEMGAIVRQLDLFVSETLITSQAPRLSQSFRQAFKTKSQLTESAVTRYFTSNPTEVMAFRAYIQQLVNLGVIRAELGERLVIAAFQALEQAPQNQALARAAISNSQTGENDGTGVAEMYELPPSSLPESTQTDPAQAPSSAEMIDFGEQLDEDQKTSMAADALERELEEQARIERNTQLARALIEEFSQGKPTPESLGRRVERVVSKFAEQETREQAETFLDNVEVSIASVRNGPEYAIRGLKAFDDVNTNYFSFAEFGMTSNDEDATVNVGIGIRKLSEDQTIMGGINAFYDQEIDTNHKRGSIGVELVSAPFRFNANRYYALSDGTALSALQTEKPMSGHDVDVEVALPYLPGLFAGYNQATWYGEDGVADIERKAYRVRGQLSQNLSVEFGQRQYSHTLDDQNTAQLSYNYVFGANAEDPKVLDIDTQPYRRQIIGPRERFRMVERENQIVTQVTQAGLLVTFTAL